MKLYVALLHAISILAFNGSTLADHSVRDCSHAHETSLHDVLLDSLGKCFGKVGNLDLETLEYSQNKASEVLTFFAQYCTRQDVIKDCLSTSLGHSSPCQNGTEDTIVEGFVEDILKTALRYGCVADGGNLAFVLFTVRNQVNSTSDRNALTDCFATAKATGVEGNTADTSARILGFYGETKVFRRCLVDRLRGTKNKAIFSAELILNGILRSMECPHPEDTTPTLCETSDPAPSTEEKVCPFVDVKRIRSFEMFFDYSYECAELNLNQLYFDDLHTYTTIEDYRSFFKNYCGNRPIILNCLGDVWSHSKVCQNKTNHKVLEMFKYFIEYSSETGCKRDGANLATIANGLYNRADQAVRNDTLEMCRKQAYSRIAAIVSRGRC